MTIFPEGKKNYLFKKSFFFHLIPILFLLSTFFLFIPVIWAEDFSTSESATSNQSSPPNETMIRLESGEYPEEPEIPAPPYFVDESWIRTKSGRRLQIKGTTKILFTGDVMWEWGVEEAILSKGLDIPFEDWDSVFHSVDKRVINLETTLYEKLHPPFPGKAFVFRGKKEWAMHVMKRWKVDAVSLANNHSMDFGEEGMRDTIDILKEEGISSMGAGFNDNESYSPIRWNIEENNIHLFASSDVAERNFPFSKPQKPGVAFLNEMAWKKVIRKESTKDLSILNLHWGLEYSPVPSMSQRKLAKRLLDAGFGAIIGHHPHVPQGIEVHNNKPIIYSLGNFVFGSKNHFLRHNIVVILHIKNNIPVIVEIIPAFGRFQEGKNLFFPLGPGEAEEFLEEYAVYCKKLGTDLHIQGGRGYVFLDKNMMSKE